MCVLSVEIPNTKVPSGLLGSDSKRPDGLILIAWQGPRGRLLCWNVTVVCPVDSSYIQTTNGSAMAATCKDAKLSEIGAQYRFQSTALESLSLMICEVSV